MTLYQTGVLRDGSLAALMLVAISGVYWFKSNNASVLARLLVASPGLYFVGVFVVAVLLSEVAPEHRWTVGNVVAALQIAGFLLAVVAQWRFEGPRIVYLLALPLVGGAVYLWALAGMSVAHDWL